MTPYKLCSSETYQSFPGCMKYKKGHEMGVSIFMHNQKGTSMFASIWSPPPSQSEIIIVQSLILSDCSQLPWQRHSIYEQTAFYLLQTILNESISSCFNEMTILITSLVISAISGQYIQWLGWNWIKKDFLIVHHIWCVAIFTGSRDLRDKALVRKLDGFSAETMTWWY